MPLLCTATNLYLVVRMVWFSYTDNLYTKMMICSWEIFTTSIIYLNFKVNNKNDTTAYAFWAQQLKTTVLLFPHLYFSWTYSNIETLSLLSHRFLFSFIKKSWDFPENNTTPAISVGVTKHNYYCQGHSSSTTCCLNLTLSNFSCVKGCVTLRRGINFAITFSPLHSHPIF